MYIYVIKNTHHTLFSDFSEYYFLILKYCLYFIFAGEYVIGRVIKAMHANWHPDCFRCELCNDPLADTGFIKNAGR